MPPTRLQRSGETVDALRAAIRDEFGPSARIVAAEKVTTGGVGGLFRKHHYEATVEVPAPGDEPSVRIAIAADGPRRVGILALLEEAEDREARLTDVPTTRAAARAGSRRSAGSPASVPLFLPAGASDAMVALPAQEPVPGSDRPETATRSDVFATIMDDFTFNGLAPAGALADVLEGRDAAVTSGPSLLSAPIVLPAPPAAPAAPGVTEQDAVDERVAFEALAGPPVDPVVAFPSGGTAPGAQAGSLPRPPAVNAADGDLVVVVGRAADAADAADVLAAVHGIGVAAVTDRRSAILARAQGVQESHGSVAALSWSAVADGGTVLRAIGADQVWVVVDAGRKHDDTVRDVRSVAGVVPVAGLLVVGAGETATPQTVHMLGLPVVDMRDWTVPRRDGARSVPPPAAPASR